jgi:hypothetical protein
MLRVATSHPQIQVLRPPRTNMDTRERHTTGRAKRAARGAQETIVTSNEPFAFRLLHSRSLRTLSLHVSVLTLPRFCADHFVEQFG